MGEILVKGEESKQFLQELFTNNIDRISNGQAQYHLMCNEFGGVIDDVILYKKTDKDFLIAINASNTDKDFAWILKQSQGYDVSIENASKDISQLALQGPRSQQILQKLCEEDLGLLKRFFFTETTLKDGTAVLISRTGYTGEEGFEIYLEWNKGPSLWRALLEAGQEFGIKPCGLGARDTLRLEVKYPLYGQELNEQTQPQQCGLSWAVKLDKPKFIGKEAMVQAQSKPYDQLLVGVEVPNGGIPRQGYKVFCGDQEIGVITSGTQSPSLKKAIALAFVKTEYTALGTEVAILIRDKKIPARICETPFYKRPT
jgi:aminomethyltransferase